LARDGGHGFSSPNWSICCEFRMPCGRGAATREHFTCWTIGRRHCFHPTGQTGCPLPPIISLTADGTSGIRELRHSEGAGRVLMEIVERSGHDGLGSLGTHLKIGVSDKGVCRPLRAANPRYYGKRRPSQSHQVYPEQLPWQRVLLCCIKENGYAIIRAGLYAIWRGCGGRRVG